MTAGVARPMVLADADVLGRSRTGDETYWRGLLGAFVAGGHVARFDIRAATRHPDEVPDGITAVEVPARGQLDRLARRLPALARSYPPDLYHGNYFLPRGWRGPSVVTVHDISFARSREYMPAHDLWAFRRLVPVAMRRCDRVLTVTEWARADIVDRYGLDPRKVVVTPNAVDDDLDPQGEVPQRPPYLLFVGGLQRRKDPVTAVEALALLPELDLVIVGRDRGEGPAVAAAVRRAGLERRVHVLDYVERPELIALYRGALALVFPSLYEGFGLPLLEAMACGTPVVAAATTSIPEVVGDAGVLVPAGDPGALAEGVQHAIGDSERLVADGLRRAGSFRWSSTAARTAAVYDEVIDR